MSQSLIEIIKDNQILSVYMLASITYLFREVPKTFLQYLIKQSTITLTIENIDTVFSGLSLFLENEGYTKNVRSLKVENDGDNVRTSVGYGNHYFFYDFRPIKISRIKESDSMSERIKERYEVKTIGRSQKFLRKFIDDINIYFKNIDRFQNKKIRVWSRHSYWYSLKDLPKRDINSVIMDEENKKSIIDHISNFINSEDYYNKNGIPYRTGILLYGPPGTGKTSLIRAIATHFDRHLYTINLNNVNNSEVNNIFQSSADNSILAIEDCDIFDSVKSRDEKTSNKIEIPNDLDLSSLLNAIDGIGSGGGKILIMTTNKIEKIDDALLRPGRCDLKINMSYVTSEMASKFYNRVFGEDRKIAIKGNKTMADLECEALRFRNNPEKFVEYCQTNE